MDLEQRGIGPVAQLEEFLAGLFHHLQLVVVSSIVLLVPVHRFGGAISCGPLFGAGCQILGFGLMVASCWSASRSVVRAWPQSSWLRFIVYMFYGFWISGMIELTP